MLVQHLRMVYNKLLPSACPCMQLYAGMQACLARQAVCLLFKHAWLNTFGVKPDGLRYVLCRQRSCMSIHRGSHFQAGARGQGGSCRINHSQSGGVSKGHQPANVALVAVVDKSGSMQGSKIELVRNTVEFLGDMLGPQDALGLVTYSDQVSRDMLVLQPLQ